MSREDQAGLNGHTLGGERAATVAALPLGEWVGANAAGSQAAAAAPQPKPLTYLGIDRIENGFIIRGHAEKFGDDFATRVAYSPAEAGAAVAELLQRHMAEADLKGAPGFAVLRFEHSQWWNGDTKAVAADVRRNADAGARLARARAAGLIAKPAAMAGKPGKAKPAAAAKPAPKKPAKA